MPTATTEAEMMEGFKALAREFTARLRSFNRGRYDDPVGPNGRIFQKCDKSTPARSMIRPAFLVKYNCDLVVEPPLWEKIKTMAWGTEGGGTHATTFAKGRAAALARPILDLIEPLPEDMGRDTFLYYVGGYAKVAGDTGYDADDPLMNLEFKLESRGAYTAEFRNLAGDHKTRPDTPYEAYVLNVHVHKKWTVPEFMMAMDMAGLNA